MSKYLKHQCQHCGSEEKLVVMETDDVYKWSDIEKEYVWDNLCFYLFYVLDENERDYSDKPDRCANCGMEWTGKDYDCKTCLDTKEISVEEKVYQNEPYTASIGTGKCPDCA